MVETRWAKRVSAHSSSVYNGTTLDLSATKIIGWSAGFTLVKVGGVGMLFGRSLEAWVMAACVSTAAPSRLRLRSNSSVTCDAPRELTEVIEIKPAMVEN